MARNIAYGHDHRYTDCGIQTGEVEVTPVANEVTTVAVKFPEAFAEAPVFVAVSPETSVPYTYVRYAAASEYTATGFKLHLYRTNTTSSIVKWMALGKLK